jgi:hypothetical protein
MYEDTLEPTRTALHRVAAYVVSPARRQATGNEIALTVLPGGFGTPTFGEDEQVRVEDTRIVHRRRGQERAAELTTLRDVAHFVGLEPDVEWASKFDVPPPGDLDAPLGVDLADARRIYDWFALGEAALRVVRGEARPEDAVSDVILWPEHFDVAIDLGPEAGGLRATYGASPGDEQHAQPYLYVSPWTKREGERWNDPAFGGASLRADALSRVGDPLQAAVAFFRDGRRELLGY